jgi:hypothetical protein
MPPASRCVRYAPGRMLFAASYSAGQTLALLVTFLGIGVFVNVLIVYIVVQVMAEHRQNREPPSPAE